MSMALPKNSSRVNRSLRLAGVAVTLICCALLCVNCRPEQKDSSVPPAPYSAYRYGQGGANDSVLDEIAWEIFEDHNRERHARLQDSLLASTDKMPQDFPLLTIVTLGDAGFLCLPSQTDAELCLLVFSSSTRARYYARSVLGSASDQASLRHLSAREFLSLLVGFARTGITSFIVDNSPYCEVGTATLCSGVKTVDDIHTIWAVYSATRMLQYDIYITRASQFLRDRRYEQARNIAIEIVNCVDVDNPRVHLLLGECGLRLSDRNMVEDAERFLRHFDPAWGDSLRKIEATF